MTHKVAFISVYVGTGQRISLSALVQNPHKVPEGKISRKTGSGRVRVRVRECQVTKEGRREQPA